MVLSFLAITILSIIPLASVRINASRRKKGCDLEASDFSPGIHCKVGENRVIIFSNDILLIRLWGRGQCEGINRPVHFSQLPSQQPFGCSNRKEWEP